MAQPKTIVLASSNPGKLRELAALLAPLGLEVTPQSRWGARSADEPYLTFLENALAKARHAARETGLPALADDSGICCDALGGLPGARSARFARDGASDEENNSALARAMAGQANRRCRFACVAVFALTPDDPLPIVAQGEWVGEFLDQPLGDGGFGYDPFFFDPKRGLTAAQMPMELKNVVSHRAQALAELSSRLRERLGIGRK